MSIYYKTLMVQTKTKVFLADIVRNQPRQEGSFSMAHLLISSTSHREGIKHHKKKEGGKHQVEERMMHIYHTYALVCYSSNCVNSCLTLSSLEDVFIDMRRNQF